MKPQLFLHVRAKKREIVFISTHLVTPPYFYGNTSKEVHRRPNSGAENLSQERTPSNSNSSCKFMISSLGFMSSVGPVWGSRARRVLDHPLGVVAGDLSGSTTRLCCSLGVISDTDSCGGHLVLPCCMLIHLLLIVAFVSTCVCVFVHACVCVCVCVSVHVKGEGKKERKRDG